MKPLIFLSAPRKKLILKSLKSVSPHSAFLGYELLDFLADLGNFPFLAGLAKNPPSSSSFSKYQLDLQSGFSQSPMYVFSLSSIYMRTKPYCINGTYFKFEGLRSI